MVKQLKKFASMFPIPPSAPGGKNGDVVSYLNPITDKRDVKIDFGIMDAAWFLHHPNESRKYCDVRMESYNYINLADAIELHGRKSYLDWVTEITRQIKIIHSEFYTVVPVRAFYLERVYTEADKRKIEEVELSVAKITELKERPDEVSRIDTARADVVQEIQDLVINNQPDIGNISLPFDYAQPCTMVEGMTTAKYPPETRKWIHHTRYMHPLIDELIKNLMLYEKVSEHMGENVITYNSDTCSVELLDWNKPTKTERNIINPECVFAYGTPHHYREIMRERMLEDEPDFVNNAWTELNGLMAKNHPIESFQQTEPGTGLWMVDPGLRDARKPHGLVAVNDFWFWKDYIDPIKIPVADDLFAYLKDACQLVNHMYPLLNKVRAEKRNILHEPIATKTVEQEWLSYKTEAPESGEEQAPIDVEYILNRWGYASTEVFKYDWDVNIGLPVEETYPRKKLGSGTFTTDLLGNKIDNTIKAEIDDGLLIPEEVIIPIA